MEALQGRDGDKDDNSLLAVADFDLIKTRESACELQDETLDRFPSCSSVEKLYVMCFSLLPSLDFRNFINIRPSCAELLSDHAKCARARDMLIATETTNQPIATNCCFGSMATSRFSVIRIAAIQARFVSVRLRGIRDGVVFLPSLSR